jgi:signal transduction histidine kinase
MSSEKPRILVADDEIRIHDFFIEAFKNDEDTSTEFQNLQKELFRSQEKLPEKFCAGGFDLTLCTSAMDAVGQLVLSIETKKPFSAVFLDVRMPPGPDGIWAAETIRSLDKDVEIVIVTAFSDIHPSEILKRVPPAHKLLYLQKPCYVLEIRHMARALCAKWAMERELNKIREQQELRIQTQKFALDEAHHALEKMQKLDALGMFAGAVSHDFNNILTAIMGHTELALMETSHDGKVHKRIEHIHKACYRAKDLVNSILTFCRQNEPEYSDVFLADIIQDVVKLVRPSAGSNIKLVYTVSHDKGVISADSTQVQQVLMNLCSNALFAMRDNGGVLDIRTGSPLDFSELSGLNLDKVQDTHVVMRVSDTGKGMDEQVMEKMFDPYFTTKGKNEGTGLGLAVVHGIVKKQGGFIHVLSEPGLGTTFYIFFKTTIPKIY